MDTAHLDLTVCHVWWVLFLQGSLCPSPWSDLWQTYVGRWGGGQPYLLCKQFGATKGVRELQACKESTGLLALSLQACSSLTPGHGTSPFVREVGQTSSTFPHRFVGDQTRRRGVGSPAKKELTRHDRQLSRLYPI